MEKKSQISITNKKTGEVWNFFNPFLNNAKNIVFKKDALNILKNNYEAEVLENEKKLKIQKKDKTGKIIKMDLTDFDLSNVMNFKKKIITAVNLLIIEIESGKENLIAFNIGKDEPIYYLTSETILKNSNLSCKFEQALDYCLSKNLFSGKNKNSIQYEMNSILQQGISAGKLKEQDYNGQKAIITDINTLYSIRNIKRAS